MSNNNTLRRHRHRGDCSEKENQASWFLYIFLYYLDKTYFWGIQNYATIGTSCSNYPSSLQYLFSERVRYTRSRGDSSWTQSSLLQRTISHYLWPRVWCTLSSSEKSGRTVQYSRYVISNKTHRCPCLESIPKMTSCLADDIAWQHLWWKGSSWFWKTDKKCSQVR